MKICLVKQGARELPVCKDIIDGGHKNNPTIVFFAGEWEGQLFLFVLSGKMGLRGQRLFFL